MLLHQHAHSRAIDVEPEKSSESVKTLVWTECFICFCNDIWNEKRVDAALTFSHNLSR